MGRKRKKIEIRYDRMTQDGLNSIRYMRQRGATLRQIVAATGFSLKTVHYWVRHLKQSGEKRLRPSRLDGYKEEIEKMIMDSQKWGKQSYTFKKAREVFLDAHPELSISYPAFCAFIRTRCTLKREEDLAAIPLEHEPGEAQIDFFDAKYFKDGQRVDGHGFTMSFPYSDAKLVQIYPAENQECLIHAMIRCFEVIGFVPKTILFDNAKTAVSKVYKHFRKINSRYYELSQFYGFDVDFCNPSRGRDKANVERNNEVLRREFLSPPPEIGMEEEDYNTGLLRKCMDKMATDMHHLKMVLKSRLFEEDRKAGLPLPELRFDERRPLDRTTNTCALVRVRDCWYSTSDKLPSKPVKVMLGAFHVDIYDESGHHVCTHKRSYLKGSVTIDKGAYVDALKVRPRAKLSKGIRPEGGNGIETLTIEQQEEVTKLLQDTRPTMKADILREYIEVHANPDALFELQPYVVSKENYDEIIKQNGDMVQKTSTE